jgi:hypothetical protein
MNSVLLLEIDDKPALRGLQDESCGNDGCANGAVTADWNCASVFTSLSIVKA